MFSPILIKRNNIMTILHQYAVVDNTTEQVIGKYVGETSKNAEHSIQIG
jgi:hypothetical protein